MDPHNPGTQFDPAALQGPALDPEAVAREARDMADPETGPAALAAALRLIDLTTLAGDDTPARVRDLCATARQPLPQDLADRLGLSDPRVAAVCVYPAMVPHAVAALDGSGIPVASVAAGFPAGLSPFSLRLEEIRWAIAAGASEIDVVITRAHVLTGDWAALYDEIAAMRAACAGAHLKVILSTGELGSLDNVRAASLVAMQAGADFIKTSTGKEAVNATLPVGLTMMRALGEYGAATGNRVGFKPAGGIKTADDALAWRALAGRVLGADWQGPALLRLGASSVLGDIVSRLRAAA